MREKKYFTRQINIDISVASIGINSEDWYCCNPGMRRQDVRETMLAKKYDVVPIINAKGNFDSYFVLNQSDSSKLDVKKIEKEDRLYYLTHVRDAVWRMNKSKKTYFFLSNGHDENDIVGLLSLSNFNSREFYVYLFSILSYIEREFAAMIESDKAEAFIILEKCSHSTELKEQLKIIQERIEQDEKDNNENDYKEYLYIHHLIWLIKEENKFLLLKYNISDDFINGTSSLKELRNEIAHPVRSIVRNMVDLNNLDSGMNKIYEFRERLENYLSNKNQ